MNEYGLFIVVTIIAVWMTTLASVAFFKKKKSKKTDT